MSKKNPSQVIATPIAEGIRIEIGEAAVYAVRNEEKDITVRIRRETHFFRDLFGKIPFLRGIVRLLSAISRLFSGLSQSSRMSPQTAVRGGKFARGFASLFGTNPQTLWALLSGLAIPVIFAALALGIPELLEWALLSSIAGIPRFAVNTVCCMFRIGGALLSIYCISRLRVINRICMYRGAASKVVNAYEAYGPNLSHEEALLSSRLTDKSDGAFALVVMILSLIAFACVRTDAWYIQLIFRIGAILAAAAVANELILPLERAKPETFGAMLRTPLVSLQQLFTIEPHNQMIEVAVCALRAACENDLR